MRDCCPISPQVTIEEKRLLAEHLGKAFMATLASLVKNFVVLLSVAYLALLLALWLPSGVPWCIVVSRVALAGSTILRSPGRLPDLLLHCHSFPLAYTFRTLVRLVVNQYASMDTVACRLQICFAVAIDLQLQAPCCEEPACRHSMPKLVMKYRNQSPWPQPKRGKARANMKRPAAAKSFKFVPYVRNQGVQKPFRKERERYGTSVQYLIASRLLPPHPEVDQG